MPRPKGLPKTGGRRKGTPNKTSERFKRALEEAARRLGEVIPDAFQGNAHQLLAAVYKNPAIDLDLRIDAAKAAIRFETPALSNINANIETNAELGGRLAAARARREQRLREIGAEALQLSAQTVEESAAPAPDGDALSSPPEAAAELEAEEPSASRFNEPVPAPEPAAKRITLPAWVSGRPSPASEPVGRTTVHYDPFASDA